jgi:hypothetical protein
MDSVIVYVPSSVQNGTESLGLKALEDFDVGIGELMRMKRWSKSIF